MLGSSGRLASGSEVTQVRGGGECGGGERCRLSSLATPLSSSTSQHLFAAFLVRFAGGGEGASGVSGGDG
jgi:hypothetical protein